MHAQPPLIAPFADGPDGSLRAQASPATSFEDLHRAIGTRLTADVTLCSHYVRLHELLSTLERLPLPCPPLEALRGTLGLLRGELESSGHPVTLRQQRDIVTLVRRLDVTTKNLLHIPPENRLSMQELEVRYAEVDAVEAIRSSAAAFDHLARSREVDYRWEHPRDLRVQVDVEKLHTILLNLLFNAFKNTPRGGCIAGELYHENEQLVVRLSDTGFGVAPTIVTSLFDRRLQKERGTPMGFSLGRSRDLASLMGGTLELEHSNREGTSFVLRLPRFCPPGLPLAHCPGPDAIDAHHVARVAASELDTEQNLDSKAPERDPRPLVLIVEDSPSVQRVLISALSREYATASALDGLTGLEKAIALQPDLIVLDVMLPRMDGPQLISALRSTPDIAEVPVLVVTADDTPDRLVRLFENGAQDVIHKPFLVPELMARARNLLWTKKTRDLLNATIGRREMDIVQLASAVMEQQQDLRRTMEELQEARRAAEKASLIKSNFLRMISHELKTPLTAMQLQIRMLEQTSTAGQPRLADGLNRVRRSSRRLHHLVETMLEWARINSGRAEPQLSRFDVSELVKDVCNEFTDLAHHKNITLRVTHQSPQTPITSDRQVTRLVLVNVVERAVQVTQRGSIHLHVQDEGESCVISVTDGAPAIPPHLHEELFDPLPRVDDLGRSSGSGSGIGLHVVRDLTTLLGGTIALHTPSDVGNTLRMRLPTFEAIAKARANTEATPSTARPTLVHSVHDVAAAGHPPSLDDRSSIP